MACNLVPSDVHDMATRVGKEFQRLIEEYGCSSVSTLVPTVVEALEHLENYVEQYQKVQTQNFKLMLEQDSLATERERREKLKEENAKLVEQLHKWEAEAKGLVLQVERVQLTNEELNRTVDKLRDAGMRKLAAHDPEIHGQDRDKSEVSEAHVRLLDGANLSHSQEKHDTWRSLMPAMIRYDPSTEEGDILHVTRIHRRLSVAETQLELARSRMLNLQLTIEKLTEENQKLKTQAEEYKAEVALQTLLGSEEMLDKEDTVAKPKFYKKDLLVVLREKNVLKEQLDATREELAAARTELKRLEVGRGSRRPRPRSENRVRNIVDSFTESVCLQPVPDWVHVQHPPS